MQAGYLTWRRSRDRLRRVVLGIFFTLCSPLLWAKQVLSPCQPELHVGSQCRLAINALHPTQPGLGLLQVEKEVEQLKSKSAKKLWAWAQKKRIPVVIGLIGAQNWEGRRSRPTAPDSPRPLPPGDDLR